MKQFISISALSVILLICACNNRKSGETVTVKSEDGKEKVTMDMNSDEATSDDHQKIKESLSSLTPMTETELRALVPDQLLGGKKTDANIVNAMGTNSVVAEYHVNNDIVEVIIFDCAGPAGAGIYATQFESMIGIDREDEEESLKTIQLNGKKVITHCQKDSKSCTIMYIARDRLMVSVTSETVGLEKLKEAISELRI